MYAVSAFAVPCPTGTPAGAPFAMEVGPELPTIGSMIDVKLNVVLAAGYVACLDGDQIMSTSVPAAGITHFTFIVPGAPAGQKLTGLHKMAVVSGGSVYQTDFATGCPVGITASGDYNMSAEPRPPKIGSEMNVSIDQALKPPYSVCLDDKAVINKPATSEKTTQFTFQVPGNPRGQYLTESHTVTVIANGIIYQTKTDKPVLKLNSVTSDPLGPGNDVFTVRLHGEGFAAANRDSYIIQLNYAPLDLCWTDSQCAVGRSKIRGEVTDSQTIKLLGIDPVSEQSGVFKIFWNGYATDAHSESGVSERYWTAILISSLVTLALAGIVLGLARLLKSVDIEGDSYIVRALFLDKQTNTYSLSKLQFYIWTMVAVFGYVYLCVAKNWFQGFFILPAVPSGLPGIVGIAAGTAIGSQVVTNMNGPKGAGQPKPTLADFVTTGDVVAAERVQFFVWTIIGAVSFLILVARIDPRVLRDLPDVPSSLLAISGLSAFGYLGGKLARDPGPVITEAIVTTGPDPDAKAATQGSTPQPPAPPAPLTGAVTTATSAIAAAKQKLDAVASSASIQNVLSAAKRSMDAALAAIQGAGAGGDAKTVASQVQKLATDADAALKDATTEFGKLAGTPKAEADNAQAAVSAAQQAVTATQTLATALQTAPAGGGSTVAPAAAPANLGRIELRGSTLSQDANFRVSLGEESSNATNTADIDISFDWLIPSPKDDKQLKKPRIVEADDTSSDKTMAKRLLLVFTLNEKLRDVFKEKTKHSITIINPDSQKAVFKFTVPESQKP